MTNMVELVFDPERRRRMDAPGEIGVQMRQLRADLISEMRQFRIELAAETREMRNEWTTELRAMRAEWIAELRGMRGARASQDRDFRITFGAIVVVAIGVAGMIARTRHWL